MGWFFKSPKQKYNKTKKKLNKYKHFATQHEQNAYEKLKTNINKSQPQTKQNYRMAINKLKSQRLYQLRKNIKAKGNTSWWKGAFWGSLA